MKPTATRHPATLWAENRHFDPVEVACTTAVVLKILDGKCKMLDGEKAAILAVYEVVRELPSAHFNDETHLQIAAARNGEQAVFSSIHTLRVFAEEQIPKPVMKRFKALLHDALFG